MSSRTISTDYTVNTLTYQTFPSAVILAVNFEAPKNGHLLSQMWLHTSREADLSYRDEAKCCVTCSGSRARHSDTLQISILKGTAVIEKNTYIQMWRLAAVFTESWRLYPLSASFGPLALRCSLG